MDNKTYLDQIAVKGKRKVSAGPIFSPFVIKLIITGVIAFILMIVVGNIISSNNKKVSDSYKELYATVAAYASDDGPFRTYYEDLKSSDLRAYSATLTSSLATFRNNFKNIASVVGVDPDNIDADVAATVKGKVDTFSSTLEDAKMDGKLDTVFSYNTSYQISELIMLETSVKKQTTNTQFAQYLDASIADLTALQSKFQTYSNTH